MLNYIHESTHLTTAVCQNGIGKKMPGGESLQTNKLLSHRIERETFTGDQVHSNSAGFSSDDVNWITVSFLQSVLLNLLPFACQLL